MITAPSIQTHATIANVSSGLSWWQVVLVAAGHWMADTLTRTDIHKLRAA
jgi:hypothetical protein